MANIQLDQNVIGYAIPGIDGINIDSFEGIQRNGRITTLRISYVPVTGSNLCFFAMWFDMEYNKELR